MGFSEQEITIREDLLGKIMTCDHVKGILIARQHHPFFVTQIESLKKNLMEEYISRVATRLPKIKPGEY